MVTLDTAFKNVVCQGLESCGTGSEHSSLQIKRFLKVLSRRIRCLGDGVVECG